MSHPHEHVGKKIRRPADARSVDSSAISSSPGSTATTNTAAITMDALPTVAISHVATFVQGGNLSSACRSTLEAIRELHYKIDMKEAAQSFSVAENPSGALASGHMGLQPSGVLTTGRVVARITVTGCSDYKKTKGGYQVLEKTVQRVVQHSITTLRSISVSGHRGKDSGRVAAIVGVLVPVSAKHGRVAPLLTRVHLHHGAIGVVKAGKAIAAGLWPALEELEVPVCHGNASHFLHLWKALESGRAPFLRVLNWDKQSCSPDDDVLRALSEGQCPRIERLSFTEKYSLTERRLNYLGDTLHACPNLLELRMDSPRSQLETQRALRDLTAALEAGIVPRLASLVVRVLTFKGLDVEVGAFKTAAASRVPPIHLELTAISTLGFWW